VKYDPKKHHRRSIRLKGYDYSRAGAYFVTICTQTRACLFGEISDGKMKLNDPGTMVQTVWDEIETHYPVIETDEFVIMPNHIHGIIVIIGTNHAGAGPRACPCDAQPHKMEQPQGGQRNETGHPQGIAPTLSLPDVVHRFKSLTTKRYIDGVKQNGWPPFPGRLWQRNYYEHIIRNENELNRIRQYIINNPVRWEMDRVNPNMGG